MSKWLKAIVTLLAFIAAYFLVSAIIYLIVVYINGGSVFSPADWRAFGVAAFANAWAGYLGVYAGLQILHKWFEPYRARFVGIAFIILLGIWFVPLTLIYVAGGVLILLGEGSADWPPEGEFPEYILGLVRAVVAVISAWVMLVKRHAKQSG